MATCSRAVWRVVSGCQRLRLNNALPPVHTVPVRPLAAAKTKKKDKKEEEKEVKPKRVIDDTGRHKPFGKTSWTPVDDVYILRYYPRRLHPVGEAVELLQTYSRLDFTPRHQPVYLDLQLNMKLEKKFTVTMEAVT